jgi:hypothetical protein
MVVVPLADFTDKELITRMGWLARNLYYDGEQGKTYTDVIEIFRETKDECERRGLTHAVVSPNCARKGDPRPVVAPGVVIRYAERRYLEELMTGIVSFGPATDYRDSPFEARKDDETKRRERGPNGVITIGSTEYPCESLMFFHAFQDFNYHLLCTSREESMKLCREFKADGFVRIRDYKKFFKLLKESLDRTFPQCKPTLGPVRYYDDRSWYDGITVRDFVFSKPLEFKYQREFRFAVFSGPSPGKRFAVKLDLPEDLLELELY